MFKSVILKLYDSRTILCVVAVVCMASFAAFAQDRPDANPASIEGIDLKGKVVMLLTESTGALQSESESAVLTNTRFTEVAGQTFIVGTWHVPANNENILREAQVGYAWEKVISFIILTPDEYELYVEAYELNSE